MGFNSVFKGLMWQRTWTHRRFLPISWEYSDHYNVLEATKIKR